MNNITTSFFLNKDMDEVGLINLQNNLINYRYFNVVIERGGIKKINVNWDSASDRCLAHITGYLSGMGYLD